MKTYSMDLRERVWQACQQKQGTEIEIAKRFRVSIGWVQKVKRLYRKTGIVAPLPKGGDQRSIITGELLQTLEQAVDKHPDATLHELIELCELECSRWTVARTLKKLGFTRKKRRYVPANKTART